MSNETLDLSIILEILEDKKAEQIRVYDVGDQLGIVGYFIFCSGNTDAHTRAIAGYCEQELAKEGERLAYKEGVQSGRWIVLDYMDFVIHIFQPSVREYYRIDSIWQDRLVEVSAAPAT